MLCLGAAGCALMALITILNFAEDYSNQHGRKYEHADAYRNAAIALIFVCVAGIIFHLVLYALIYKHSSTIQLYFTEYNITVSG